MLEIYCDGGASPNPGIGGIGFVIYRNKKIILEGYQYIGKNMTNNQCEFIAAANSLAAVITTFPKEKEVTVFTDSRLVVGAFAPKPMKIVSKNLVGIFDILRSIIRRFVKVKVVKIPREENELADKLCQIAKVQKNTKLIQHGK